MNSLLLSLEVVAAAADGPVSASDLCERFGVSVPTLKRAIAEARHLGADVYSLRAGAGWGYVLGNEPAVRARLARWLDLERSRSLVG